MNRMKFLAGALIGLFLSLGGIWLNEAEAVLKGSGGFSGGTVANATNFSSAVGFADGTAAAPSIAWTSDQDGTGTGLYRSAADQVAIAINGSQAHTFSSNRFVISSNTAEVALGSSGDAIVAFATTNSLKFGTSAGSTVTSRTEMNKATASIADNVATSVMTITVPNAAHSASYAVTLTCSLGAGGAIGANEATGTASYIVAFTRTAGVAAVGATSAAYGAAATAVAGAATVTVTGALSAVSGAVGATNTFTFNATVARSGGSSTNHTCLTYARLMNANSSGITIS
jgi:hypothetical protein